MRRLRWLASMAGCLALMGCERAMFQAQGTLASDGGRLGRWSERPQGCSRDPWDGKPLAESSEVVSFFWEDSFDQTKWKAREKAPDAPLRLDLYREGLGVVGRLQTVANAGIKLDGSVCRQVEARTTEQPTGYAGGRPTLRGSVVLDCRVEGGRVTAAVTFERCEY